MSKPGGTPPTGPQSSAAAPPAAVGAETFNRSLLRAIQEASPEGILVVDEHAMVVSYNRRFLQIWGIPPEWLAPAQGPVGGIRDNPILESALRRVKHPEAFLRRVRELYADPMAEDHSEIPLKDGRILERHSVGLRDDQGHYLGRVWFFRDITERKLMEAELRHRAWYDALTGVPNRSHFLECAEGELARARRYGRPLALLMLDLDRFKRINDRYGHAGGDQVLKTACERWGALLRRTDLLARVGGEEFVVLTPESGLEQARTLAERLREVLVASPVEVPDAGIAATVSVGVAVLHPEDTRIENVLHRADTALYRAKEGGRNRVEVVA